jgi:hypothetical protein
LERIGFDNWVERGSLRVTFENSRFDPSDLASIIVFWAAFLVVLQLAFGVFGPNPVSDLLTGIIAYLPNVFVAVIIVVIASALAKVVTDVLSAMLGGATGGRWIARGAGLAILIVGIFAALNQLEIGPVLRDPGDDRRVRDRRRRRRRDPDDAAVLGAREWPPRGDDRRDQAHRRPRRGAPNARSADGRGARPDGRGAPRAADDALADDQPADGLPTPDRLRPRIVVRMGDSLRGDGAGRDGAW